MALLLKLLKSGMLSIADVYTNPRGYIRPSVHDFQRDHDRLVGDVRQLGDDMRGVIARHGEQPYQSSSHQPPRGKSLSSAYNN